ncbi:MAG: hypothetical protein MZV63_27390 [Marinilabiliales bacterium]|nr:hypothetical protein [Marinilabiliales bacterium]
MTNDDWFVTQGGDGFWVAIDPTDPNIVYTESQYGNASRYDRRSGQSVSIKPYPRRGRTDLPLELGHAHPHQPALTTSASTWLPTSSSAARTRAATGMTDIT